MNTSPNIPRPKAGDEVRKPETVSGSAEREGGLPSLMLLVLPPGRKSAEPLNLPKGETEGYEG